jgi:hypothetical protein
MGKGVAKGDRRRWGSAADREGSLTANQEIPGSSPG